MAGREPSWNVFADLDRATWTELIPTASKDRLVLPRAVRSRVPFLGTGEAMPLLAILSPGGFARLVPLEGEGGRRIERVRDAILAAPKVERPGLILAATTMHARLALEPSGRFVMPSGLGAHLGAHKEEVRVVVQDGELFLWREQAWLDDLAERLAMLPPLFA